MRLGQRYLADYGATRSRPDFTQRQSMTCCRQYDGRIATVIRHASGRFSSVSIYN